MLSLHKIASFVVLVCAAASAQSGSATVQSTPSPAGAAEQPAKPSAIAPTGQAIPPPKVPEFKLEPVAVPNVAYPPEARDEKIEGEVLVSMRVSGTGDVVIVGVVKGD